MAPAPKRFPPYLGHGIGQTEVCLLHLVLTVPMRGTQHAFRHATRIMVLYNYISNQCGDDIQ